MRTYILTSFLGVLMHITVGEVCPGSPVCVHPHWTVLAGGRAVLGLLSPCSLCCLCTVSSDGRCRGLRVRSSSWRPCLLTGSGPGLPATESDAAVALALQHEFGQQRAPTHEANLEETGLFFCQICQKNLSAMNVTRREQHVNR